MQNMINRLLKQVAANKRAVVIVGVVLLIIIVLIPRIHAPAGDPETAHAVAVLLSRASISDLELSTAMKIPGVRDVYVVRDDGMIELPARQRGSAIDEEAVRKDAGTVLIPVGEDHRVVVTARKRGSAPQSPIMVLLLCVAGGIMIIVQKRRRVSDQRTSVVHETRPHRDDECRSIDLELAACAADAALVCLDRGCRVLAASSCAQKSFAVKRTGRHLVDILDAREAQPVLQLIRKSEKEGQAYAVVRWNNARVRAMVISDGRGYLIKLSQEDGHE